MKKVLVLLAGTGFLDGSEIYETVLALLELDRRGIAYQCVAPDIDVPVVDHLTGMPVEGEHRSLLREAARLARGDIKALDEINVDEYDGLLIPGGYGVAHHICTYARSGSDMAIHPGCLHLAQKITAAGKPIGLVCIAAAMAPAIGGMGTRCTVGTDQETIETIFAMGGEHQVCESHGCVVDLERRIVTTPAYMLAERISEVQPGIQAMTEAFASML